ncbi:MAG: apolipoprotein N-acyltransferase [bacterium]|nr:apolipoprotein N-acyltransferase [bacterium]
MTEKKEKKKFSLIIIARGLLLTTLSALLLRAAYPPYSFWILAIPAIALFLHCIARAKRPFLTGLLFGTLFQTFLTSWLFSILYSRYDLGIILSVLFYFLLICVIPSLMFGIFAVGVRQSPLSPGGGTIPPLIPPRGKKILEKNSQSCTHPTTLAPPLGVGGQAETDSGVTAGTVLYIAAFFTAAEWLRTTFSPEYGWGHLASIFYRETEILFLSSVTGGGGLSFLVVLSGAALLACCYRLKEKDYKQAGIYILVPVLLFSAAAEYGYLAVEPAREPGMSEAGIIDTAIIHPGIVQARRWREQYHKKNLALYRDLSMQAFGNEPVSNKTRLIVWPETAVTYNLQSHEEGLEAIREIARQNNSWVLVGTPSYRGSGEGRTFYNSVFLFSPSGKKTAQYDKNHLLPFTEKKIAFLSLLANHDSKLYEPGTAAGIMTIKGSTEINLGPAICYEICVSSHIHRLRKKGAGILINISNDAWFGKSSESIQQVSILALRCAEFGIPAIRTSGYGIAAILDRYGRIRGQTAIDGKTVLRRAVSSQTSEQTIAGTYKDWFILLCGLYVTIFLVRRKK